MITKGSKIGNPTIIVYYSGNGSKIQSMSSRKKAEDNIAIDLEAIEKKIRAMYGDHLTIVRASGNTFKITDGEIESPELSRDELLALAEGNSTKAVAKILTFLGQMATRRNRGKQK